MPNKQYRAGYAAELRAKRILERQGWFVLRSAGSHSPVDLVALHPSHHVLLVQVKRGSARLSREERTNLKLLKSHSQRAYYGVTIQCWRFVGRGKPVIEVL